MLAVCTDVNKTKKALPDLGISLVRTNESVVELRLNYVNDPKHGMPIRPELVLLEIVQSQETGKLYLNLPVISENVEGEEVVLKRDNTQCIEHFNYEIDPYGKRHAVSSRKRW